MNFPENRFYTKLENEKMYFIANFEIGDIVYKDEQEMEVTFISDNEAICVWRDENGFEEVGVFNLDDLSKDIKQVHDRAICNEFKVKDWCNEYCSHAQNLGYCPEGKKIKF